MCAKRFDSVIHVTVTQNGRWLILDSALFPRKTTIREVMAYFQERRKGTYAKWGFYVDKPLKGDRALQSTLSQFPLHLPTGVIPYDHINLWVWYLPSENENAIAQPVMTLVG